MSKPLEYNRESITDEEHKMFNEIYANIAKIQAFGNKVNLNLFIYLFGEQMGRHYAACYVIEHNRNIFSFMFNYLDSDAKGKIMVNIFKNETLYAHC